MLLDLINLDKVRRAIIYMLLLLAVLFVQDAILSRLTIFGVRAMILPLFPVALGLLQGGLWGVSFGLICGLLTDAMLSEHLVMFTILFPCFGLMATAAERFLISRRLVGYMYTCGTALIITAGAQALRVLLISDAALLPVLRVILLQTLFSLAFAPLLYFPCQGLADRNLD